jgi:hypothetical protein
MFQLCVNDPAFIDAKLNVLLRYFGQRKNYREGCAFPLLGFNQYSPAMSLDNSLTDR